MGGVGRAIGSIFGGGGGGGGRNITYNVPQPAAPAPIDYNAMYAAATRSAIDTMREQEAQVGRLVPTYESLQFNTVNRLAQGLDNQYLATLRNTISQEMGAAASPSAIEAEVQRRATEDFQTGPTVADRQIQAAGLDAMGVRADQVGGPRNIREIAGAGAQFIGGPQAAMAGAGRARFVGGPQAAMAGAGRAGFVSGPQAAMARGVANVGAGQVGAGALGNTLMTQAMRRAQSDGRLSAEANRDAAQAARAGMAARGMATGNAGLAAELLNRDRFARSRQAEDLAFAQGVQGQDVERQFANVANRMRADQGNQEVAARMALANQAAQNQMAQLGYQGSIEQLQAQAARDQQANLANQAARNQMGLAGYQGSIEQFQAQAARDQQVNLANAAAQNQMGLAGYQGSIEQIQAQAARNQQANMANQQRDQVLGEMAMRAQMANQAANQNQLAQNRGFMLEANNAFLGAEDRRRAQALGANQLDLARRQRLLGLAGGFAELDPFARAINPAFQVGTSNTGTASNLIGSTFQNSMNTVGNVESFNRNLQGSMFNSWQNNNAAVMGANMQSRAMRDAGMMNMIGQIGSSIFSDKRMKKEIKPLGKSESVLGLKLYSYKYKGDDKKRVGVMAQDVQKVLPEAVEEVNYKGKKRLAIKPAVIGAALAEELAAQAA